VHGEDGQQVYYAKQANGSFVGQPGARSTLSTVAGGYRLVRHDQVTYQFDSNGVLLSELDRNGKGLSFTYANNKLAAITDSAGHVINLSYNSSNLLSSLATPDGRTVSYGYTSGRLTSVTRPDPDGGGPLTSPVFRYTYDSGGRLATEVDPDGHTVFGNTYDPTSARVTQQVDANGKTTGFAWDPSTQTATVTDPNGHAWKDVYSNGVLVKRISGGGDTTQLGHDADLNTNSVTSPNGADTTTLGYSNGNLMSATAPPHWGASRSSSPTTARTTSRRSPTPRGTSPVTRTTAQAT
jgi:YD repeat-containing protein